MYTKKLQNGLTSSWAFVSLHCGISLCHIYAEGISNVLAVLENGPALPNLLIRYH